MKVSKVMQRGLWAVGPDKTLGEVEAVMEKAGVQHVAVVEHGALLGVISDRDIKRSRSPQAGTDVATFHDNATLSIKAHQIMTRHPLTIREDADVRDAIDLFVHKRIHFLPVTDASGAHIGHIDPGLLLQTFRKILDLIAS